MDKTTGLEVAEEGTLTMSLPIWYIGSTFKGISIPIILQTKNAIGKLKIYAHI
jgi:hypothetical protein